MCYDPALFPGLLATLRALSLDRAALQDTESEASSRGYEPPFALIVTTLRQPETLETFVREATSAGFDVSDVSDASDVFMEEVLKDRRSQRERGRMGTSLAPWSETEVDETRAETLGGRVGFARLPRESRDASYGEMRVHALRARRRRRAR